MVRRHACDKARLTVCGDEDDNGDKRRHETQSSAATHAASAARAHVRIQTKREKGEGD